MAPVKHKPRPKLERLQPTRPKPPSLTGFTSSTNTAAAVTATVLPLVDRAAMSAKQKRTPIWWILVFSAIAVVVMLVISYRGWNARNRPEIVAGSWYLDDLRTDEEENERVYFSPSGEYQDNSNANIFGIRWSYRDGKIFFRTWRLEDESQLARNMMNTTLYSWIANDTDEFPLTAEFSDDGLVLTLIAEDAGPRCRLRRANR